MGIVQEIVSGDQALVEEIDDENVNEFGQMRLGLILV